MVNWANRAVGDLGRGTHHGQRSQTPREQAGHKTASDKTPITSKVLAFQEPSAQDKADADVFQAFRSLKPNTGIGYTRSGWRLGGYVAAGMKDEQTTRVSL